MATQEQRQHSNGQQNLIPNGNGERLASALGWFSIGLGVAELLAPTALAKLIGVKDRSRTRNLLRIYGVREIAAGVGILTQPQSAGWVWSRVAGDLVDLSSLGSALNSSRSNRGRVGTATAAVLGVTALDVLCAQQLSQDSANGGAVQNRSIHDVTKTIIIDRPAEEIYRYWRDLSNLPGFMKELESVQVLGNTRSHWRARAAAGKTVEWDAEIVDDQPNSSIAWRSLEGSDFENSGSVRFEHAPGDRGTLVRVELRYTPLGGVIGAGIAKFFRAEPGQQIEQDLRSLKQLMETGEIAKSDASIHRGMHPAQPSQAKRASA